MDYSETCENKTCNFFPTERYTADEVFKIISSNHRPYSSETEEIISGRNISRAIMNFFTDLPEANGSREQGLEWFKKLSDSVHAYQKELYITVCPGCDGIRIEQE
jgi:hypothetical protein